MNKDGEFAMLRGPTCRPICVNSISLTRILKEAMACRLGDLYSLAVQASFFNLRLPHMS